MSDIDINSMMKSLYPTLKMDTQTEAFIKDFLEKYRKMILLKAKSKNLNDIQDSFRKITLGKLRSSSILAANKVLLSKKIQPEMVLHSWEQLLIIWLVSY